MSIRFSNTTDSNNKAVTVSKSDTDSSNSSTNNTNSNNKAVTESKSDTENNNSNNTDSSSEINVSDIHAAIATGTLSATVSGNSVNMGSSYTASTSNVIDN